MSITDIATGRMLPVRRQTPWHEAMIRRIVQSEVSATSVRVLAYMSALAVLAVCSFESLNAAPAAGRSEAAPPPEWIEVARPFPAFALPMPELGNSSYGMRRHHAGGGRRDILSWGDPEGDAPHLMVEIYRPGGEFTSFGAAEKEIAARAGSLADAAAITPLGDMETKFGPVSLIEFAVKSAPQHQCLGFVRAYDQPRLQILGWYCSQATAQAARDLAACALDRLTLMAAGSDPKLGELFARAELKRSFCGQRSPIIAATPKLGPSASLTPDLKLRARLAAR